MNLKQLGYFANRGFVFWVMLAAVAGYLVPGWFGWVAYGWTFPYVGEINGIMVGLGLIMFGMGMTLSRDDVVRAGSHPEWIALGVAAQYLFMPMIAFALSVVFGLNEILAAGVILVGCCPGGTASNVIAFLSDADVPLSVSVTLISTLLAPLVTPWLMWLYAQNLLGFFSDGVINVPIVLLAKSIFIIVVPIVVGLSLKQWKWGDQPVPALKNGFTLVSVTIITLIVAYVVASVARDGYLSRVGLLVLPVVLHNLTGLATGYGLGTLFSLPLPSARALSIEVGMQNSGLGVALATIIQQQMAGSEGVDPAMLSLIAVPSVLFSVWHNISGPVLASWWSRT